MLLSYSIERLHLTVKRPSFLWNGRGRTLIGQELDDIREMEYKECT